jgi:uncharacterized Zn finger protein
MPRKASSPSTQASKAAPVVDWSAVTWDELHSQFGKSTVTKGEQYSRSGHVVELSCLATGELLAWVDGTERYATRVTLKKGRKGSPSVVGECSCPVGSQCKHAVAVVLQGLLSLQSGAEIPLVEDEEQDERLQWLEEDAYDETDEEDGWDHEGYDDDWKPRSRARRATKAKKTSETGPSNQDVAKHIDELSVDAARKLLQQLVAEHPGVREQFKRRLLLSSSETPTLVKRTLAEIRRVTAEPIYVDHWDDSRSDSIPDFSLLQQLLERLSDLEQFDELLELGAELRRRGLQQVRESHDEDGELSRPLGDCLDIVFEAIPHSSLPAPEQLLYAIDALLDDEFSICEGAGAVLDHPHEPAAWSVVADQLASRVQRHGPGKLDDFSRGYERSCLTGFLISALDHAGRTDEALQWCETEAVENGEYQRLCLRLRELGRSDELRTWALRGIRETEPKLPGIAHSLRELLTEDWKRAKEWGLVAAAQVVEFCEYPTVPAWKDVLQSAKRAKCEAALRESLLWSLERGRLPIHNPPQDTPRKTSAAKNRTLKKAEVPAAPEADAPGWPLPPLPEGYLPVQRTSRGTMGIANFLIDLALDEGRIDDAIARFEVQRKQKAGADGWTWGSFGESKSEEMAVAVAAERPEYALQLRHELLSRALQPTGDGAYDAVVKHLKAIRELSTRLHREGEFARLVEQIRTEHRRRRNLLEKLDRLERPQVVSSLRK